MNKFVKEVYDSLAAIYDSSFLDEESKRENRTVAYRLRTLLKRVDNASTLDLGCGTGAALDLISLLNYVGIDFSPKMLEKARAKFPEHTFIEADMTELPEDIGIFDNVISLFGSISYADPIETVRQINRVTKKGSKIYLMYFRPDYSERPSYILNRHNIKLSYCKPSVMRLKQIYVNFNPVIGFSLAWFRTVIGEKQ